MNRGRPEVLIVDDEALIRELLATEFEKRGISTETASNAMEALEKIKTNNFSLVISDLRMPGGNGELLLKPPSKEDSNPPVILMTSIVDDTRATLISRGALAVIQKPLRIKDLVEEILPYYSSNNSQSPQIQV